MNQQQPPRALGTEQLGSIKEYITKVYQWKETQYEVKWWEGIDQKRVPILVAIPRILDAHSPFFALLPDATIVTHFDVDAYIRIVNAYFPKIAKEDAPMLADLFLHFGKCPYAVGMFRQVLDVKQKKDHVRIEFLTKEMEMMRESTCILKIYRDRFEFDANVKKKE
jgi:hypothetical protein